MKTIEKKAFFALWIGAVLLGSCQNNQQESYQDNGQETAVDTADKQVLNESKTLTLPYIVEIDSLSTAVEIKENPQKSKVPLTKDELAEALNTKYPEIHLVVGRMSHDTLQVSIPEATYLTQQYGTTGATTYLAEATYAFTEIPQIKVVNFSFKEGDHAVPGPYTRKSFNTKNL
ncbi:hypothetical protein GCM10023231_26690 [Olivibacter ginsenosidimutans]|uniref:Uncharacterized protein n=1 Tax=Olivibacter ginsenosidimutans TaxID=1176537 RepID=A0ABP9BNT5_9SPHI